mmetsp:Transcript_32620/g.98232  ORF Transcript_32620/g.98232 Transcript_32620/m.98232 type:complete len:224 (+) Transcript_32620:1141-1812(+)
MIPQRSAKSALSSLYAAVSDDKMAASCATTAANAHPSGRRARFAKTCDTFFCVSRGKKLKQLMSEVTNSCCSIAAAATRAPLSSSCSLSASPIIIRCSFVHYRFAPIKMSLSSRSSPSSKSDAIFAFTWQSISSPSIASLSFIAESVADPISSSGAERHDRSHITVRNARFSNCAKGRADFVADWADVPRGGDGRRCDWLEVTKVSKIAVRNYCRGLVRQVEP